MGTDGVHVGGGKGEGPFDRPRAPILVSIQLLVGLECGNCEGRHRIAKADGTIDDFNEDMEHFTSKKTRTGLAMVLGGEEVVLGKLKDSLRILNGADEARSQRLIRMWQGTI